MSGLACAGVRLIFRGLQWCFTGHSGLLPDAAATLPWAWRAALPAIGGLLAWLVLRLYRRIGPAEPFTGYVEAVRRGDGRIPFASTAWRTAASAFSIATGAAVGREGSMIQFAAAVSAWLGGRLRGRLWAMSPASMVACGAAGAVAAAYQAPVAGVFFASEIVLGRARPSDYGPLLLASCAGWLVSRPLLGPGPVFAAPAAIAWPTPEWLWLLPMAPLLAALGPVYQRLIRSMQDARRLPLALMWSGVVVGLLSIKLPTVWGNGDEALLALVHTAGLRGPSAGSTGMVLLLRLAATCFCVGAGVIGGVFTPTLFAGAAMGLLFAWGVHAHVPLLFVIAGLSCLLAAVTHAPLMTTFMAVELTGKWPLLPLLLVCNLVSSRIARHLSPHSLYGIASAQPGYSASENAQASARPQGKQDS